jgi:tetratricopeptide (TPR) repeat protein
MKLFISYRRDDSAGHAGRVHDRLVLEFGRDHLFMDVADIRPGADFAKVLGDKVAKCDVLLALIGPRWIDARDEKGNRRLDGAADFVRIEIATALERDIPVFPILFDGATVPRAQELPRDLERLVRRNALDVRHASFHSDMERLIAEIRRLADEGKTRRATDERSAISNIPIRVPIHFMGREDALAAIEKALGLKAGRAAITALHGLRGVGKTTLAAAYAERHRGDHRAIWWLRAQTEITLRADLVGLGIQLGWVGADDKEQPAVTGVMERLRHEGEGILLIYDNTIDADSLRPYLPLGGDAKVLVTSNAHALRGVAVPVEIRLWPKEIGADYLVARTGRVGERSAAEALSEALGGLPLAHEQAAAYCDRLGTPFAEYRKRFEPGPVRLLDDTRHAPLEHNDGMTVAKSFALAIEEAAKLNAAAEPLIVHAALLGPEPIPLFLFAEAREKFGASPVAALDDEGLDESIAALRTFALIDRESIPDERDPAITTETIRLHRLVREVAATRLAGEAREDARRALIAALAAVYPSYAYNNPTSWPRCALLTPHALALCGTKAGDAAASHESAELLAKAGSYFVGRAAYGAARPLFERVLAIYEKVLGPEAPDTATSLNNLASLRQDQGDLAEAQPLFERALAIREKVLGPEHPDTAWSLNNLAILLRDKGYLAGAHLLFERALAIREKVNGPEHPDTATGLNVLARLLRTQHDLASARSLSERALAIREKVNGPEHPDTAWSLETLGAILHEQGDLARGRSLSERALAIREKVLGAEHPDTAWSLNSLATLLRENGDLAGARPLFERALVIREKVLGAEHFYTAESLNNLAVLLTDQGELAPARLLSERALAIDEKVLGPEAPDTATSLVNLAYLLKAEGDVARARLFYERGLQIRQKVFGPEHPATIHVREVLARLSSG